MDKKVQVQPTAVTADVPEADVERAAQSASKPAWHAPVITRIDIKRTMGEGGPGLMGPFKPFSKTKGCESISRVWSRNLD